MIGCNVDASDFLYEFIEIYPDRNNPVRKTAVERIMVRPYQNRLEILDAQLHPVRSSMNMPPHP